MPLLTDLPPELLLAICDYSADTAIDLATFAQIHPLCREVCAVKLTKIFVQWKVPALAYDENVVNVSVGREVDDTEKTLRIHTEFSPSWFFSLPY